MARTVSKPPPESLVSSDLTDIIYKGRALVQRQKTETGN